MATDSSDFSGSSDADDAGQRQRPRLVALGAAGICVVALIAAIRHLQGPRPSGSLRSVLAVGAQPGVDESCEPDAECKKAVEWAWHKGFKSHPEWYPGLEWSSTFDDFQNDLAEKRLYGCPVPCSKVVKEEGAESTMATDMPCTDQKSCLEVVDKFLDSQPRTTFLKDGAALVQTFGTNTQGGGSCGVKFCALPPECPDFDITKTCRVDTYDNALTAIYYTMRGRLEQAKPILDAFLQLMYPTSPLPYTEVDAKDLPSKRTMALLAASYTSRGASAGQYWGPGVADGAVDTGNNAWIAMAFARYAAATGEACYALPAYDIMEAIRSKAACSDELMGFMARLAPYKRYYRSAEHNIDMFALSRMLNETDAMDSASHFVHKMYGYTQIKEMDDAFATGTDGKERCDTDKVPAQSGATPVDAQLWNMLAGAVSDRAQMEEALRTTLKTSSKGGFVAVDTDRIGNSRGEGRGESLTGFRFSSFGTGVQWENTASGIMGLVHYRSMFGDEAVPGLSKAIVDMRESLLGMLRHYGSVLASTLGGNMNAYRSQDKTQPFPGGADTGLGWTYLRYPHTAATAWTGMLLHYQAAEDRTVDEGGNPYARPMRDVPTKAAAAAAAGQCLPVSGVKPDGVGASCQAHAGCAQLEGDCCPTPGGMNLGCC